MKSKKGQALIEFIIILPIFILLILGLIDVGKIVVTNNNLENRLNEIVETYQKNNDELIIKTILEEENIDLEITSLEEYTNIIISKDIEILTPGLNLILKSPYKIEAKRVIPNE